MKNKKVMGYVLWVLIYVFVAVNVFVVNVVFHEVGHFVAAEHYGLRPVIEFDMNNVENNFSLSLESKPIASTKFLKTESEDDLFVITLIGPLMNLLIGLVFLFSLLMFKTYEIKELCFIGVVLSFVSFVMNMIPVSGSDGIYIFGHIF